MSAPAIAARSATPPARGPRLRSALVGEWSMPVGLTAGVVIAGLIAISALANDYRLPVLMTAMIYGVLLVGMDVQIGYANQLTMSQPAFMAIGAYSTAAVSVHYHWSPAVGLLIGLVITLVVGYIVARAVLRVSGMALTLVSLFLLLISTQIINVSTYLGGANGLTGIVPVQIGTTTLATPEQFSWLVLVVLAVVVLIGARLMNSGPGLEVHLLAEDEPAARALGINVRSRKVQVFLFGAITADIAGWLFAHGTGFVSPDQFDVSFALTLLLMLFLGGRRSIVGGIIGAVILGFLPTFSTGIANNLLIIEGVLLTLLLMFAREGIAGLFRVAAAWGLRRLRGHSPVAEADPAQGAVAALLTAGPVSGSEPILATDGISKRFGGLTAVDEVTLAVPSTGILPVVGPNGAGKTTYFAVVSGLLSADGGRLTLAGQDVTKLRDWQRARLGIARTFQLVRLPGSLTVLDNVAAGTRMSNRSWLVGTLFGTHLTRSRQQAREVLGALGIAHLASANPRNLTLADQRFVELARVLAGDPQLILLDEPASGLSDEQRAQLAGMLREIAGVVPILLIEHDLDFIGRLADEVVVLALGRTIYHGSRAGLADDPVVAEAYLGSAVAAGGAQPDAAGPPDTEVRPHLVE
jgi:branched-chain amino acid transport system permease protein